MEKTFDVGGPVHLDVQLTSGRIEVDATHDSPAVVELIPHDDDAQELVDKARVELRGRELIVDVPWRRRGLGIGSLFSDGGITCRIRCPEGSSLRSRTKSADLTVRGRLAGADIATASGDAELGDVDGDLVYKGASGDLRAGSVAGKASVNTASGDLSLGGVGATLSANSASGDLSIEQVAGDAKANTASGDISIESVVRGDVAVNSASGDVRVGIARGSRAYLDCSTVSGDTRSELDVSGHEPDDDGPLVNVKARTVSGDIAIVRGSAPAGRTQEVQA